MSGSATGRLGITAHISRLTVFQQGHMRLDLSYEAQISAAYSVTLPIVSIQTNASGLSVVGLQRLCRGPVGSNRAIVRISANVPADVLLGVVRWGYSDPVSDSASSYVEKGWDAFRSSAKVIDYADIPAGKQLEVWVRWTKLGVGWTCQVLSV